MQDGQALLLYGNLGKATRQPLAPLGPLKDCHMDPTTSPVSNAVTKLLPCSGAVWLQAVDELTPRRAFMQLVRIRAASR